MIVIVAVAYIYIYTIIADLEQCFVVYIACTCSVGSCDVHSFIITTHNQ